LGKRGLGQSAERGTQHSVLRTRHAPDHDRANPKSKIQNLKSSIEETALAVEALLAALPTNDLRPPTSDLLTPEPRTPNPITAAVTRGLAWLIDRVEHDEHRQPAPIGFYFAKLWYYEKLYPLIFATAALGRAWVLGNVSPLCNVSRQFAPRPEEIPQPETASSRSS
jgi:hypothetical protein